MFRIINIFQPENFLDPVVFHLTAGLLTKADSFSHNDQFNSLFVLCGYYVIINDFIDTQLPHSIRHISCFRHKKTKPCK